MASLWRRRHWVYSDPINLLTAELKGQDRFFGASGQPPTYDWPNPPRPKQAITADPPNLLLTVLRVSAAPFYQIEWPNPQRQRYSLQADSFSSLLVGPLAVPFSYTDWPLPQQVRQPQENRGFTRGANVQLLGQDRFFGAAGQTPVYDYPNPQRTRYPVQPEPPPNVVLTTVIVLAPFYQVDWPNPQAVRQPQDNRGWVRAANVQLIGQDRFFAAAGQAPVYDYQNPQRPRGPAQADCQSSILVGLFARPFYQTDWPLPQRLRYPVQSEPPPNLLMTVSYVAVYPFALLEWPNPQTLIHPQESRGFVRPANVQLIGLDQFFAAPGQGPAYDWPNPQRPRYPLRPGPPPNLISVYLPPPPPPLVRPDYVWTEGTRSVTWGEVTRILVWAGTQQRGQQKVLTLLSRTLESAIYAYDFSNDAAVLAGDSIASVTSVAVTPQNQIALAGALPSLGIPMVSGKRVLVMITAPGEPVGVGGQFLVRFTIHTVAGLTRVGLGIYVVSDQGP